jgi:tetraacyldisaccharide 4'-kinase
VLSRGYKRKTKGFLWVTPQKSLQDVGDEPLEMLSALQTIPTSNTNKIAVCEDRVNGIQRMQAESPNLRCVLLDDGYQHLKLQHNLGILLCNYQQPFTRDWPLPAGKLREFPWWSKKANLLLVTNCPSNLSQEQANTFKQNLLNQMHQWMRFCPNKKNHPIQWEHHIAFLHTKTTTPQIVAFDDTDKKQQAIEGDTPLLLVTGIANPQRITENAPHHHWVDQLTFPDHHPFKTVDIQQIQRRFQQLQKTHPNLVVVTTRKDLVRLQPRWPKDIPLTVISATVEPLLQTENQVISTLKQFLYENQIA